MLLVYLLLVVIVVGLVLSFANAIREHRVKEWLVDLVEFCLLTWLWNRDE
jgi:hypothetical protein